MIDLVWSDRGDRLVSGRYRILRRPNDRELPWRLDALAPDPTNTATVRIVETARCHSLLGAQRAALAIEGRRARTLRASIHAATALGCAYAFAFLAISPLRNLTSMLVAIVLLGMVVRSIGNAVGAKRKDLWGWQPEGGSGDTPGTLERWCDRVVHRTASFETPENVAAARVRVLPPE